MNDFINTLLSLSVSGTVLLFVIWGLRPFYKNKFSNIWQYYIWLIAAMRFVLPFTPDTTVIGSLFDKINLFTILPYKHAIPATADTIQTVCSEAAVSSAAAQNPFCLSLILFYVWSILAFVFLFRKITMYQEFTRYIKAGNIEVSDLRILNLLSDCKDKLTIKTRVELYQNPLIASPIMTGLFHPSIILPVKELTDKELNYILTHELIHCKQKDLLYKWFIQSVICLHWFNPAVYLLEKAVNRACELSCDEIIIASLDKSARQEYGNTLMLFLKSATQYNNPFASVTLTTGAIQLKERLGAIMHYKKQTKFIKAVSITGAILLSAGAVAMGAYAAQPDVQLQTTGLVNHTIIQEDGIFYIYCDGSVQSDQPTGGITDGSIGFVLVRKDGYTSISGFNSLNTLLTDVENQCDYMLRQGTITEAERNIVLETAAAYHSGIKSSLIYNKQGEIVGSYVTE